uniref:Putative secreted protein n=1 Tax=Anopheles marajoara TaxID=58244 RepID=A0A2M4C7P3_9DIPT
MAYVFVWVLLGVLGIRINSNQDALSKTKATKMYQIHILTNTSVSARHTFVSHILSLLRSFNVFCRNPKCTRHWLRLCGPPTAHILHASVIKLVVDSVHREMHTLLYILIAV